MSRAAFALDTDAGKSSSARMSSGVRVSKPGDSHEVEADRVADTVVRGGQVPGWSLAAKGFDGIQRKPAESQADVAAQVEHALLGSAEGRAAIAKVTAGAASGIVVTGAAAAPMVAALAGGRKGAAGGAAIALDAVHPGLSVKVTREGGAGGAAVTLNYAPATAGKHAAPEKKAGPRLVEKPVVHEPATLKREPAHAASGHGGAHDGGKKEELTVHRKAERAEAMYTGSAEIDSVVRSPGREMEPATRREMESRIGFDFGRVRLHTDTRAGESAQSLSARAYTVGSDVVFAPGKYAPQTTEGRHLLAHELTHVVQQTGGAQQGRAAGLAVTKPAARMVQRSWWSDVKDWVGDKIDSIKNWLLGHLKDIPGYDLFCTLIGKDLATGEKVDNSPEKLIGEFLKFFGFDSLYEKLKGVYEALKLAFDWLIERVRARHLTLEDFEDLLKRAWDAVELTDLSGTWERLKAIFAEPLNNLKELVKEIASKVLELIAEAVFSRFPAGRKIWPILKKAGQAIGKIAANPLRFGLTLLEALKKGFQKFYDNIGENLKEGLLQFVFDEIGLPDLKAPKSFDLSSMFNLALEVLGLTYARRRKQLVEKLEPLGGEVVVEYAEKAVEIVQQVRTGGFGAIWGMIKDKLESIPGTIFNAVKGWAVGKIVKVGLEKIAALSNPVGEIIEVIEDIVEMVKFFIEKATQLIDMFEAMVDMFSDLADGNSESAAVAVAGVIKKSIPLILRFLAGIFGFGDFGAKIKSVITDVRETVDDAIGKVLDFIVDKITPIWNRVKESVMARIESVKEWWTKPKKFNYGTEEHEVSLEGDGAHPEVFVHSDKTALEHFLDDVKATKKERDPILKAAAKLHWKQGELEKPSGDEAGAGAYERLVVLLGKLKARDAPKSEIKAPGPLDAAGGGTKAEAFLSTNRELGTEPNDTDPAVWEDLGAPLRSAKSYVRGHLLSMRLGGQGVWPNMMPITNKVNQRMNAQVEAPLKRATANTSRYYHYTVKAEYTAVTLPDLSDSPKKKELMDRGKQAEKRLVSLSWITEPAEFQDGKWVAKPGPLLDENGKDMPTTVAAGDFTPPTLG